MAELTLWIEILFTWHLIGWFILSLVWVNNFTILDNDGCLLNPCWIYNKFNVNYFGCGLLTLIFNLLCPVASILYWLWKAIHYICTVGRR